VVVVDLRKELDVFFQSGPYGLSARHLLRRQGNIKCDCVDAVTGDAKSQCALCAGTGYRFSLVPVDAVKQVGVTTQTYPFISQQTPVGWIGTGAQRWYFPAGTAVKEGDDVWDVTWRGDQPGDLIQVYRIAYVDLANQHNKSNTIVRAYGHTMPFRARIARYLVRQQSGRPVYEPQFGGSNL
jgi:hypothetical protein